MVSNQILNSSLGAIPDFYRSNNIDSPLKGSINMAAIFLSLTVFLPVFLSYFWEFIINFDLLTVSIWGSAYFFFATLIARSVSRHVEFESDEIIKNTVNILDVKSDILKTYSGFLPNYISFVVASIGISLSIVAIVFDIEGVSLKFMHSDSFAAMAYFRNVFSVLFESRLNILEILIFSTGLFVLYFSAARCTYVSTYYLHVVRFIDYKDVEEYYNPSKSPLILRAVYISRIILIFWLGISMSISTLPIFFPSLPNFVLIVAGTSVFFSLLVGTAVYICSEQHIRNVVRKAKISKSHNILGEVNLLIRKKTATEGDTKRYKYLLEQQDRIDKTTDTSSYIISILSLFIPLIGTVIGIITKI